MVTRLHSLSVIQESKTEDLIPYLVCDIANKQCMYRECENRAPSAIPYGDNLEDTSEVWWWQWGTVNENIGDKVVRKTVKSKKSGTLAEIKADLEEGIQKQFCKHVFNIKHQYRTYRHIRDQILPDNPDEALLHIDFSENYSCKYSQEIQAVHFGGSHQQATLHTGIAYHHDGEKVQATPFCTISDELRHDPSAIWAHIDPVLRLLHDKGVRTLHFFSDGPTTQYRNKKNFYLFSTLLFERGFNGGTWNFMEAGHGKGAADGVGGVIKRLADSMVARGVDIPNAKTLFDNICNESSVSVYFINREEVAAFDTKIPEHLTPIAGTMKLHQLCTDDVRHLICKDLSCFCSWPTACTCYDRTIVDFVIEATDEQSNNATADEQNNDTATDEQNNDATTDEQNNNATTEEQNNNATTEEQNNDATTDAAMADAHNATETIARPTRRKRKCIQNNKKGQKKTRRKSQTPIAVPEMETAEAWYCFICMECTQIDMIQCEKCKKWVHEQCADLETSIIENNYYCDVCKSSL
jgi:hypothetical protein